VIPVKLRPCSSYRIKVTSTSDKSICDYSNVDFSIVPIVYPNPFRIDHNGGCITFSYLNENSLIRIYNLAGDLVFETITGPQENKYEWKVENNSKNPVVSGIYIYFINDKENTMAFGKITIIGKVSKFRVSPWRSLFTSLDKILFPNIMEYKVVYLSGRIYFRIEAIQPAENKCFKTNSRW
jgi:hypothetical protein